MKIALVGVGLIGGSFVLGLRRTLKELYVIGIDQNSNNLKQALDLGIINEAQELSTAIQQSDVIVLAIPVDGIKALLPQVLDLVSEEQTVIDFGSTKGEVCNIVREHPNRACFVAAHPIAGTEYSGPTAAFAELLDEKVMITCEEALSGKIQLECYHFLCEQMQMQMKSMDADAHDLHLAFVSHLSHISSFALSKSVLRKKATEEHIFDMAGSGFASTVRLAKSSPAMWAPIFKQNQPNLLEGLKTYIQELEAFKELLEKMDEEGMKVFISEANKIEGLIDMLNQTN